MAVGAMDSVKQGCSNTRAKLHVAHNKASHGFDAALSKAGAPRTVVDLIHHLLSMLKDQMGAVLPISLLQILVLAIFFQQAPDDAALQVMGLVLAIVGLVLFLEGLRVCVMPMAEQLGTELPKRLPLPGTLLVAFFLGVLVTYAEPAIAALRPLGELVNPREAPYLYYVMNKQQEFLVLSIGMGVGVAAVFGTLRFIRNWPLKPMIFAALAPTIGCACYMQWGNSDLAPLLGMSWDCGAVTTGPVTVPILLALGIGVMQSQKAKRLATAALKSATSANAGNALEGFGIVTLASLLPILAVEIMAIITAAIHPIDEVLEWSLEHYNDIETDPSPIDESPLKEVVFGIRSIMPLIVALLLLTAVFLRKGPPRVSWWVESGNDEETAPSADAAPASPAGDGVDTHASPQLDRTKTPARRSVQRHSTYAGLDRASMAVAAAAYAFDDNDDSSHGGSMHGATNYPGVTNAASVGDDSAHGNANFDKDNKVDVEAGDAAGDAETTQKKSFWARLKSGMGHHVHFLVAVLSTQFGMILFNIGLTYGFTALGNQTGTTLPAAYLEVPWYEWSPKYSYAGGLILVIVTLFVLGVLATRAEPALLVLGKTVEKLSGGAFTAKMLIGAVCLGVGVGLVAGALKILYQLPLIYFILAKYTIACSLTLITADSITAVAWDSAGVTTGPVTVPFVLAIGIGFSKAVGGSEGFGMLTIMSVAPIISVLLVSLMRKPAKTVKRAVSTRIQTIADRSRSGRGGNAHETPIAEGVEEGDEEDASKGADKGAADESPDKGAADEGVDDGTIAEGEEEEEQGEDEEAKGGGEAGDAGPPSTAAQWRTDSAHGAAANV